jgi:hypothetical protein
VFISVGIAAIIMAYIGMHSCSASYNLSRTLNIFGTLDIIICVIIALIVCIVIHSMPLIRIFFFIYSTGHCTYDMLLSSKSLSLYSSVFFRIYFSLDFNPNSNDHAC